MASDSTPEVAIPTSRGVYVSGLNKRVNRALLLAHFAECGSIEQCDFSESPRQGFAWLRFDTQDAANAAVRSRHHSELVGTVIVVRHELGYNAAGARVAALSRGTSSSTPKSISILDQAYGKGAGRAAVSYAGKGLLVGNVEYPIPTGAYLVKLLMQCHSSAHSGKQALIDALLDARHGNKHAKELSESMAMVNAVPECSHRLGVDLMRVENVQVYVLGDGIIPFTAITMLLFVPSSWIFTSIDPLLSFDPAALGPGYAHRVTCATSLSQDFRIPGQETGSSSASSLTSDTSAVCWHDASVGSDPPSGFDGHTSPSARIASGLPGVPGSSSHPRHLSIVVACHSHAPLQEFWDRLPSPKIAISLPCCGKTWSLLSETSLYEYEDYEVFSPKRRVFLYAKGICS